MKYLPSRFLLVVLLVTLLPVNGATQTATISLPGNLIHNGGYMVGQDETIMAQYRPNELFQAASTIKLLTSLAVLDTFGEQYRFTTHFYQDKSGMLSIRGSGDPFLTSEYLSQIIEELQNRGVTRISGYILDDTIFDLEHQLPAGSENSHNPYDAPNGGLAVNFNSISVIRQADGTVGTGEGQTPTMSITREIGKHLPKGNHRININHFNLSGTLSPQLRYTAELLHTLAGEAGIESTLLIRQGRVPEEQEPLLSFVSPRTLRDNVSSCLYYSNNFIANQMLLSAAAKKYSVPATWAKARQLLNDYATWQIGLEEGSYFVEEGSGLSRKNRITPKAMQKILTAFYPYHELLPRKSGVRVKSGTMESVYCYAGYIMKDNTPVPFTFLLNQQKNTRNSLLAALKKSLR